MKNVKKSKISVAEAATKIDVDDLASFLGDIFNNGGSQKGWR